MAGDETRDETARVTTPGTQDAPLEDTHNTNDDERIAGIVAQTRADMLVDTLHHGDVRSTLERRLSDAGLEVDDSALDDLVSRVSSDEVDVTDPGVEQI
ncbi:hypothetical protein [Microbacterium sp. Marseille-Q6965]|uniref:hypothetical protein n=1 Tax=Microbacterium sp. Marseille-Q6965 TaxID=2965072 RepID=UPI0021B7C384|nr:hypothetical protein [Microbacterium sp. Marseille-Q6965]